jgi:hypothetical protein
MKCIFWGAIFMRSPRTAFEMQWGSWLKLMMGEEEEEAIPEEQVDAAPRLAQVNKG